MANDADDPADDDGPPADRDQGVPPREVFSPDPIEHARVRGGMTVDELVREYGRAGFGADDLHRTIDVATEMFGTDDVTIFMGLAGAMVPGGMRRVTSDLIRDGYVDAFVTTGATLTHDAIEAIGGRHHHGHDPGRGRRRDNDRDHDHDHDHDGGPETRATSDDGDDPATGACGHDERLRDEWVDRIHNVYLPQEHFTALETHLRGEVFPTLEGTVTIRELTGALGRANATVNEREGIEADPGIAAAAAEADVPIYCPAIADSILGLQAWMYGQVSAFTLDALGDMTHLTDMAYQAERTGAFVVGGGVPKNFVLQTMLVNPGAYDYAVQLTMDPPHTGGLSGATLDEARSWGKIERAGRNASAYGDATVTLPLLVAAVRERLE